MELPCIQIISSIRRTLTGHFVGAVLITVELDFHSTDMITAYQLRNKVSCITAFTEITV
jgi:ethanolamine transporter EutH